MADTTIKTVIVELIGKTDKLQKDFKKVEQRTSKLTAGFKRMGLALVGAFGARALFRGFQQTLRSTDQLIKTSKGVGFAVSEYEELIFALDQVGISAGSAKIAIGDFQKRLAKGASGVSPQFAKAFKQAGLDPQSLSKLSPAEAFDVALTRLAAIRDDPAIAGLTGNVFEEQSGKDILAALRQYEKFQSARVTFQRRIGSLTKEETRNAEALNEELKIYTAQWNAIKMNVVADTAPSLLGILNQMEEANVFGKMADSMADVIEEANKLVRTITIVGDAISNIPGFDAVMSLIGKSITTPGGFSPMGVLAQLFDIEDIIGAPAPPRVPPGLLAAAQKTVNLYQTNNIEVPEMDQARRLTNAIRKANDATVRE